MSSFKVRKPEVQVRCAEHGLTLVEMSEMQAYYRVSDRRHWYEFVCKQDVDTHFVSKDIESRKFDILLAGGVELVVIDDTDMRSDQDSMPAISDASFEIYEAGFVATDERLHAAIDRELR